MKWVKGFEQGGFTEEGIKVVVLATSVPGKIILEDP